MRMVLGRCFSPLGEVRRGLGLEVPKKVARAHSSKPWQTPYKQQFMFKTTVDAKKLLFFVNITLLIFF